MPAFNRIVFVGRVSLSNCFVSQFYPVVRVIRVKFWTLVHLNAINCPTLILNVKVICTNVNDESICHQVLDWSSVALIAKVRVGNNVSINDGWKAEGEEFVHTSLECGIYSCSECTRKIVFPVANFEASWSPISTQFNFSQRRPRRIISEGSSRIGFKVSIGNYCIGQCIRVLGNNLFQMQTS